jgi:hypothetical protein
MKDVRSVITLSHLCDLDRVKERGILGTNDMLSYKKKL